MLGSKMTRCVELGVYDEEYMIRDWGGVGVHGF